MIMGRILKILIYLCLCACVQGVHQVSWVPCTFTDENVVIGLERIGTAERVHNAETIQTELIHREAMLQFGQKGDAPVNPHAITFLVTESKVDLQRYIEGVEPDELECELRRYSTKGIHVRWPVRGPTEYSRWFSCSLKHTRGLFTVTGFLRQPSDQPPSGKQDYLSWSAVADKEILTLTAVMVIKTQTPTVKVGLLSQPKLHCQFAIDHKAPNTTLEWHWQHRGERKRLFSHNSRTGQVHGSGVKLSSGDASYTIPLTKMSSEGTYICSVAVDPLFASLDVNLRIEEAPRVSLNVGSTLLLEDGGEQKIICNAESYYPLDVEIVWYEQDPAAVGQRVGAPLPKVLQNMLLSSHRHNQDRTYSVSAFFYFQASLRDSGKQFTCSVSHKSLRVPIKKSFILTVEEPSNLMFNLTVGLTLITLLVILYAMVSVLYTTRKKLVQEKLYSPAEQTWKQQ